MNNLAFFIIFSVIVLSIGGLGYILYDRISKNQYRYYKGEIRKVPKYYKANPENAPNYYKGSLNKVPNYYKKDIKDLPNYYRPKSQKTPSDRETKLRSLRENW